MPIIENYAEHNFEFPYEKWDEKGDKRIGGTRKLVFTKLRHEVDAASGETKEIPGSAEVTADELKMLREHPVARSWFDRNGLAVREGGSAPPPDKKAK